MDKKIVDTIRGDTGNEKIKKKLKKYVSKLNQEKIIQYINKYHRKEQFHSLIDFLKGLSQGVETNNELRFQISLSIISFLNPCTLPNQYVKQFINFVLDELDYLTEHQIGQILNHVIDSVNRHSQNDENEGQILDLIPKCLALLSSIDSIEITDQDNQIDEMDKDQLQNYVISTLCNVEWNNHGVIQLATITKDIPLSEEQLQTIVSTVFNFMNTCEDQELPPLVYQLLLLSTKGAKKMVLKGIIQHFTKLEKKNSKKNRRRSSQPFQQEVDPLLHVEGTVLLHMNFAVKQDQELGKEYLSMVKSQSEPLSAFDLAFLLYIARIPRFKEKVYDVLKKTAVSFYTERAKRNRFGSIQNEYGSLEKRLLRVVKRSANGWDLTTSIVELGTVLMDVSTKSTVLQSQSSSQVSTPCELGASVLEETFNLHEPARGEILEQIFNRIVINTSSSSSYIDLLSKIVRRRPTLLIDFVPKFKESIEYLSFLSPEIATNFLNAIHPLFSVSMDLQDYVVLVLRKSIFSREMDARLVAMNGFLQLLKASSTANTAPQASSSQSTGNAPDNLDYEILGFLRRCLTQQAEIRKSLYQGLADLHRQKEHLSHVIFDLLLNQLMTYYEEDESVPFKLDKCTSSSGDSVKLVEPFAFLLFCIQKCIVSHSKDQGIPLNIIPQPETNPEETDNNYNEDNDNNDSDNEEQGTSFDSFSKLTSNIRTFIAKLLKCTLTDFELDEKADFSMTENKALADILLGVYEVSMELILLSANDEQLPRALDVIDILFQKYLRLKSLSKPSPTTKSKGKAKKGTGDFITVEKPLLSLEFPANFLKTLYTPDKIDTENHDICHSDAFDAYLIELLYEQFSKFTGIPDPEFFQDLGFYIMRAITTFRSRQPENSTGKSKREKTPLLTCIQCFELCFRITCKNKPLEQVAKYLSAVLKQELQELEMKEYDDPANELHSRIGVIEMMVSNLIQDEHSREAEIITHMLSTLTSYLSADQKNDHINWVEQICLSETVKHPGLAKSLLAHCLQLCFEADHLKKVKEYACDFHVLLGDCAHNNISGTITHSIVSEQTSMVLAQELLGTMDKMLENFEWTFQEIQHLAQFSKNALIIERNSLEQEQIEEKRLDLEHDLYIRIRRFVMMFCELVQAKTSGSITEIVMRTTSRYYKFLISILKLNISMKQVPSTQFVRLINCTIEVLSQSTHFLIKTCNDPSSQASAASIGRQARLIPNLIYNMEHFERLVIKLSNQSKVDLASKMTRNTARDFQIKIVQSQSQSQSQEPSSTQRKRTRSQKDHENPPSKKRKTSKES